MTAPDPRWDTAIDMLVDGVPKTRIAASLDPPVHRNTLNAWVRRPEFLAEMRRRLDERDVTVRLRRSHQATQYADRVRRLAESAFAEAERRPLDRASQRVVRYWMRLYRQLVAMERVAVDEVCRTRCV
jgi:hypothetical protein